MGPKKCGHVGERQSVIVTKGPVIPGHTRSTMGRGCHARRELTPLVRRAPMRARSCDWACVHREILDVSVPPAAHSDCALAVARLDLQHLRRLWHCAGEHGSPPTRKPQAREGRNQPQHPRRTRMLKLSPSPDPAHTHRPHAAAHYHPQRNAPRHAAMWGARTSQLLPATIVSARTHSEQRRAVGALSRITSPTPQMN
jgi:hypothetical protein